MNDSITILSQNVRGLRDETKRRKIFHWLHKNPAQIIFLQEAHSTDRDEIKWRSEWGGDVFFSHGTNDSRGVIILFKNNITKEIHNVIKDPLGRYLIIDITLDDIRSTLCNIYGPNTDSPNFFLNIHEIMETIDNETKLIGGDFNTILNLEKDKKGAKANNHPKATSFLNDLMDETELVDIWRQMNPEGKKYTWLRSKPVLTCSRIDYFLISFSLCNKIISTNIKPGYLSDHSAITLSIQMCAQKRGPGFWKMNSSFLQDQEYVNKIKETILNTIRDNQGTEDRLMWETLKLKIRGESITYSAKKKRHRKNIIALLEHKIQKYEKEFDLNNSEETRKKIETSKRELDKEIDISTNGSKIRCKVRWYEDGEKSSKYFLNMEKRNYNKKIISRLKVENDKIIDDPKEILEAEKRFYQELYRKRSNENNQEALRTLFSHKAPKLSENEQMSCEGKISEKEILEALKKTQNNKSPGSDGIPAEFYKMFWIDIKEYLLKAINASYEAGSLYITLKQGIITLIPKKDKDTLELKNWRPITLLNQDYKLIAKSIASRIKKTLKTIINSDQSGYVPDRYIGENINRILNMLELTDNEMPGILMLVDFQKAYDCLDWEFIDKALKFFNFGESLRSWIKTLYNDISSCTTNNGHRSDFFTLTRGVRQGCPLSPYLFIIAAEMLAISIRNNKNIQGIKVNNKEIKINQYADDTSLTLQFTAETISETLKAFKEFELASGLKMNLDKTEVLRIGSIKNTDIILCPESNLKWTNDPVKLLGVLISTDLNEMIEINYKPILSKIKNTINMWKMRNLTINGKVTIVKTLLVSKLVYLLSVLPTPNISIFEQINSLIFKYIWNEGPHRIAKNVMFADKKDGGLKVPNMLMQNHAIKLAWVKRLFDGPHTPLWKDLVNQIVNKEMWQGNLNVVDLCQYRKKIKSSYWYDVLTAFFTFKFKEPHDIKEILNQNLWYNSFIKINNSPLYVKTWAEKGVKTIKDLLDDNGKWITNIELERGFNLKGTVMMHNGILSAIPKIWKNTIKNNFIKKDVNIKGTLEKIIGMKKVCKESYGVLMQSLSQQPKNVFIKWKNDVGEDIDVNESFENIYTATISSELRNFQFKFIHRLLATNNALFKWKIIENEICTLCKNSVDSINHLFWECNVTQLFMYRFSQWFKNHSKINYSLEKKSFFFGISNDSIFNLICIITKRYLYSCKLNDCKPNINCLVERIREYRNIEKYIAIKNATLNKFNSKWGHITL